MLPEQIIYLSFILYIPAYYFYLRDITHGQNRPNLVSWALWVMGPMLGAFFQVKAGAGLSALPVFMAGLGPLVVLLFYLWHKNAYWKLTAFDIFCGLLSLLALVCYAYTHNLEISIIFAILSDALAFIPTFVKSWKSPENESTQPYFLGIATNVLGLLIIKDWSFVIFSFGLYLIIFNIAEVFILYRKKVFNMLYFKNDR
jgi:hypothetical protein